MELSLEFKLGLILVFLIFLCWLETNLRLRAIQRKLEEGS